MKTKRSSRAILWLSIFFAFMIILPMTAVRVYAASAVKLSRNKLTVSVDDKQTLKVTGTTKKITWSSSNKKVARVSSKGVVKALKAGKATISAKVGGKQLKCKVTVYETIGIYEAKQQSTTSIGTAVPHGCG